MWVSKKKWNALQERVCDLERGREAEKNMIGELVSEIKKINSLSNYMQNIGTQAEEAIGILLKSSTADVVK